MTVNLINRLKKDPEWAFAFEEQKDKYIKLYKDALDADYEWIDYQFEDNPQLLGLNSTILKQYAEYNVNNVLRSIGEEPIAEETFNPCLWVNQYTKTGAIQVAQKEKISGNYKLGITDGTITDEDWTSFK